MKVPRRQGSGQLGREVTANFVFRQKLRAVHLKVNGLILS